VVLIWTWLKSCCPWACAMGAASSSTPASYESIFFMVLNSRKSA
jgi:hypothetical protein